MFFPFFFFVIVINFFCTTWSVEKSRVVSFFLFLFVIVIKFFCTTWSVEKSSLVSFFLFLWQVGQAEGNNFFLFFFFLNFVSYEPNVMFVMLAWVGVFLVDGLKKKIIPGWKVLGVFLLMLRHVFEKCYLGKGRILYLSIWPLVNGRQYVCKTKDDISF